MKNILLLLVISVIFTGCNQKSNIDQSKICIYANDQEAKKCKEGELSYFSPDRWGSDQLPLNVAAVYCDFNYDVVFNKSGIICVFTDKRLFLLEEK